MRGTKIRLNRYWDGIILQHIPSYAGFKKMQEEISEHFGFLSWMFKRVVVPLIIFYVVLGAFLNINVFDSLFVSLLIFFYSNFLPDTDALIKTTNNKSKAKLRERYFLLFFAPFNMYYIIAGKAKPIYSTENRCFHNLRSMLIYGAFLLAVGFVFWTDIIKIVMLPVFGILGFGFHLIVDKRPYKFLR